eukprot:gene31186-39149_t
MQVSKREFESKYFKNMLREQGGEGMDTPILKVKDLLLYVRAEFDVFLFFLRFMIQCKHDLAKGNRFAQALHDGGTLVNKRKYQAIGLQFIDPEWRCNHVVCVGFPHSMNNRDFQVAQLLEKTVAVRTLFAFEDLVSAMRQDRAAKGVAAEVCAEVEEEVCDMHDGGKLGRAATGALTRSRKKVPINPFPEGVALMKSAHDMGVHFSYGTRHDSLMAIIGATIGKVPPIKIQVDLNTTRVAAQHSLLHSELRLNRALKSYWASEQPSAWSMSEAQWNTLAEFGGVLSITKRTTANVQLENAMTGSYGALIKGLTMN